MRELIEEMQRLIAERAEITRQMVSEYYNLAMEHALLSINTVLLSVLILILCIYCIIEVYKVKRRHKSFKAQIRNEVRQFRNCL